MATNTTGTSIIVQIKLRALRRCACEEECTRRTAPFDEFLARPASIISSNLLSNSLQSEPASTMYHDRKSTLDPLPPLPFLHLYTACISCFIKQFFFFLFLLFFFSFSRIKFLDKRSDTALRRPVTDLLCPFGSREISLELKIVGN